ncbi:MAG: site-2 protease family protein [Clostridiales bacterium]|nr:site-2 protease family protein [Clostridiales bacterium]
MKLLYIIIALLILLLMITIHEFGHYIAGKILGFKIDEFSIGFGPKLFSKKKKNGEVFSIRVLPLGGFCAFAGETEEENILAPEKLKKEEVFSEAKEDSQSETLHSETAQTEEQERGKKFTDQPPWKRIIVLMAGGVFNILSAVIFAFIFIVAAGSGSANIATVYDSAEPGYTYNIEQGDKIISIDGKKVDFYHTLSKALDGKKEGDTLTIVVLRGSEEVTITTQIRKYIPVDNEGNPAYSIGEDGNPIYPVGMGVGLMYDHATVGDAFKYCVPYTAELSWLILGTFGDLIVGKVPLNQVSGPIGTVNQMANLGMENWAYLLLLLPLIAANLGIFNLFPIPALDGAKVVFTIVEWIRGKPINQKVEAMIHFVGLIVLFSLVMILDVVNIIISLL